MLQLKSNSVDLSVKYGEIGKSIFEIVSKYENLELKSVDEQQSLFNDIKFIIDNNSIEFDDKIYMISSMVNNCRVIKNLF